MKTPDAERAGESQPIEPTRGAAPVHPEPSGVASGDVEVTRQLQRATRRGFVTAGAVILAGYGGWRWLATRPGDAGLAWPLRRVLQANERLTEAAFRASRLAPDFAQGLARSPRVNGMIGLADQAGPKGMPDLDAWRMRVTGGPAGRISRQVSLAEIKALPRHEQTTELKCIEGWSTIVHWAGARLADLAAATGLATRSGQAYAGGATPGDLYDYVGLATGDRRYYVGLDAASALHAQTLLCYEMNGVPLTPAHGAPLRLVIPLKYGIKNIKQIGTIEFTDRRPADYWAELGYDWYAGH